MRGDARRWLTCTGPGLWAVGGLILTFVPAGGVLAQRDIRPPESVVARRNADSVLGFSVDTATIRHEWTSGGSKSAEGVIYRNWMKYLDWRRTRTDPAAMTPYWSMAEQRATPTYDIPSTWIDPQAKARVMTIRATSRSRDRFLVETIWAGSAYSSAVIERVFAVRDGTKWIFSGALAQSTIGWHRASIGPITYVFAPSHPFDSVRARRLIAFSDSVSSVFALPRLSPLLFYMFPSSEEALERSGIEDYQKYPTDMGAISRVGLILSGDPRFAEEHRHEVVHHLFGPLQQQGRTDGLVTEGIAVWLGGTKGMDYPTARHAYGAFLRQEPQFTLDSVVKQFGRNTGIAGAVLLQMVYEKGGVAAVKSLFGAGSFNESGRETLEKILGLGWGNLARAWRQKATGA